MMKMQAPVLIDERVTVYNTRYRRIKKRQSHNVE